MTVTILGRDKQTLFVSRDASDIQTAVTEAVAADADLQGADLRGADLQGADLLYAGGADLRYAIGVKETKP